MSRLDQIRNERLKKVERLRQLGIDPFPSFCCKKMDVAEARKKMNQEVEVVGRIFSLRGHGKLVFADLRDESGQIQLMLKADELKDEFKLVGLLDLGDFVLAKGQVTKTEKGEISVLVKELRLLSKSIRPLPEKRQGLKDVEERYRQRYVDLLVNEEVKQVFMARTKIINLIRKFLDNQGFIEVETPVLQPLYGGATAKPFTTHYNALDSDFYLRIADELYLKRLVVGGFEKVYEMSKDFRNEGFSRAHNPEFTMLEFYWAYADYHKLIEFTEELLVFVIKNIQSNLRVNYQGTDYDFQPPWERITYKELFVEYLKIDIDKLNNEDKLITEVKNKDLLTNETLIGYGQILDKLYKRHIRPKLKGPMFIMDRPYELLPLAKRKAEDQSKVGTFQLLVAGEEFINAYDELNDPQDQKSRWQEDMNLGKQGADEYQVLDEDYIRALEYGMPPTAGWGMGVDRLIAFLTNQTTLKDVILFPTLKPEV